MTRELIALRPAMLLRELISANVADRTMRYKQRLRENLWQRLRLQLNLCRTKRNHFQTS